MADIVTKQELEAAKIDVKNAGEAVNEEKVVTPRYGNSFKSIPLIVKEAGQKTDTAIATLNTKADDVIAKGFYTGYATETALKASLPTVSEMRARADDTRKIWRWNRTSAEGVTPVTGTWTDTGLSDKDLAAVDATAKANAAELNAKSYTDAKLPVIAPLYNPANNIAGKFINTTNGIIGSSAGYILNAFPVEGGKTYVVSSPSYATGQFAIATRDTASTADGSTLGMVALTNTGDPFIKKFTVPANAKYAFMNVKTAFLDIVSTVKVNIGDFIVEEAQIDNIGGAKIIDEDGRAQAIKDDDLFIVNQLYDALNNIAGKFVNTTNGIIGSSGAWTLNILPVEGGKTYAVKSPSFLSTAFAIATRASNSTADGATLGLVTLSDTADPAVKTFTVPSTATYAFINVKGTSFDIIGSLKINKGDKVVDGDNGSLFAVKGHEIIDPDARARIKIIEETIVSVPVSSLKGKKWGAFGDSITAQASCYADALAARHSATLVKKAQSGAKLHRDPDNTTWLVMSEVYNTTWSLPYEPDIITIALGTNDITTSSLGVMTDRVTTTFYGALHVMLGGLRGMYPNARIGYLSQLPRNNIRISETGTDEPSRRQRAIREVCAYYSIPLWEGYKEFGFHPADNPTMATALMPDNLHPSVTGSIWYANRIEDFILSLAT